MKYTKRGVFQENDTMSYVKNRYYSLHCHNVWNVLEKEGFAEYIDGYYCLTRYGLDVLGKALGVTMYLEDE